MLPSGSNEFDSHYLNAPFPLHNMQTTKNVLTECNERLFLEMHGTTDGIIKVHSMLFILFLHTCLLIYFKIKKCKTIQFITKHI